VGPSLQASRLKSRRGYVKSFKFEYTVSRAGIYYFRARLGERKRESGGWGSAQKRNFEYRTMPNTLKLTQIRNFNSNTPFSWFYIPRWLCCPATHSAASPDHRPRPRPPPMPVPVPVPVPVQVPVQVPVPSCALSKRAQSSLAIAARRSCGRWPFRASSPRCQEAHRAPEMVEATHLRRVCRKRWSITCCGVAWWRRSMLAPHARAPVGCAERRLRHGAIVSHDGARRMRAFDVEWVKSV
jgi:hypothetical protein